MKKLFKISEGTIGTFAAFWDTLAALAYFFATEEWQLYLSKYYLHRLEH